MSDKYREQGTIEFEAISEHERAAGRRTYELTTSDEDVPSLVIRADFVGVVELRLGRTSDTSPCYLVRGEVCPQLAADYIVVQPDVMRQDPTKGWVPIGDTYPGDVCLGRRLTPQLRLGPDVSRDHCYIGWSRTMASTSKVPWLMITDGSGRNGTRVTADEADVFSWDPC